MPGPWEKYQNSQPSGPWQKYAPSAPSAPETSSMSNVPGALPGMQTPEQAAGIKTPQLHGSSIDYGKLLTAGDVAKGAAKGAGHTFLNISQGLNQLDHKLTPSILQPPRATGQPTYEQDQQNLADLQQHTTPNNTAQKIGYGGEQIGEFMAPSGVETAAAKGLTAIPKLAKAGPLIRPAVAALSSGLVNKAQGGDFSTGAVAGGAGGAVGEGIKAAAPKLAEAALGITKADRAFGKTPGQAIINETRGIRPSTIAESGQERLGQLTPQLESAADRASIKPNPVRGLLPAPAQEIPLHSTPGRNPRTSPMAFPAHVNPEEPFAARSGAPMAPISEYPVSNPHYLSGGAHPELSGRTPTPQGVLIRPQEVPAGAPPIPATIGNPVASLSGARGAVSDAMTKASAQNAESLHGQLAPMGDFLRRRFSTGSPIPENVTPRDLLDLKRGFSKEFLGRWNPETHGDTLATGRKAYGALDAELDRTVPQASGLNQRISSLIPVVNRAESTARNAPAAQMFMKRLAAPTGAMIGSAFGATEGYKHGGMAGAIGGGLTGLVAPTIMATPEGWMDISRAANTAGRLRPAVGAGLYATRDKKKDTEETER